MGKSNLFHKSSLNKSTGGEGLAKFAHYIAEDHLIADTLWYHTPNPGPNHAMTQDIARQPVQSEGLMAYFERRIRWIRVRKYMVTSATLVEPFTECFLASAYGSFALHRLFGYAWRSVVFWHILTWLLMDLFQFYTLQSNSAEPNEDEETPEFARANRPWTFRKLRLFLLCWLIREATCLPIWIVAMFGKPIVKWRNQVFKVRRDMTVIEIR
jgi:ceramide glucosyltransferase